jgi:uncharacterized protein YeaO (DUF488 family)
MIQIQRLYNVKPEPSSYNILVDGIWPRGIKKDDPRIDEWKKSLAPGTKLRKWFNHNLDRWEEFKYRYQQELNEKSETIQEIINLEKYYEKIILVYSARDENHNQALVLKEFLEEQKSNKT